MEIPNVEEKIMEFIDQKWELILRYTSRILSGMDFTNLGQYSLSKWYQLSLNGSQ